MPVACYVKKDALAYISGSRIAILFQGQEPCILIYPKRRSSNIPPTSCKFGLVSFLMRRENFPITSRNAFVG